MFSMKNFEFFLYISNCAKHLKLVNRFLRRCFRKCINCNTFLIFLEFLPHLLISRLRAYALNFGGGSGSRFCALISSLVTESASITFA